MKIAVFGAAGKVGRLVVDELVRRGHEVIAYVYHDDPMLHREHVQLIIGDVRRGERVEETVQNCDAVISVLGSWGTPTKDILSTGIPHIAKAMQKANVERIISLTGADAHEMADHVSILQRLTHILFGLVAGKILRDGEAHMKTLRASQLNWTVIRSPRMVSKGSEAHELTSRYPYPWKTIHRKAVVLALVDQLDDKKWQQQAPFLSKP